MTKAAFSSWKSLTLTALILTLIPSPTRQLVTEIQARDWAQLGVYQGPNSSLAAPAAHRVVFMGDSITRAWAQEPFIKDNPDFVGRGINGQTTPQMLVRFRADVLDLKPAAVHLMAGTNDVAENTGPESDVQIEEYLESMVELARANGIEVVIASIPPAAAFPWRPSLKPAARIKRLNAWIADYAARNRLVYVDYWAVLATPEGAMKREFSSDGVHPNAQGYAAMQPLACAAIRRALGMRDSD